MPAFDSNANANADDKFDELDKLAEEGELTEDRLKAELNAYSKALEQEYQTSLKERPTEAADITREFFRNNVNQAAAQIVWLSVNASKESTRFSACKFIVNQVMKDLEDGYDPITDLLKQLQEGVGNTSVPN